MICKNLVAAAVGGAVLCGISLPAVAATPADVVMKKKFSLENSVGGGNEMRDYYPYSLSAWAAHSGNDIFYYTREHNLVVSHSDGKVDTVSSYSALQKLTGGGYVLIVSAVDASHVWGSNGCDLSLVNLPKARLRKLSPAPMMMSQLRPPLVSFRSPTARTYTCGMEPTESASMSVVSLVCSTAPRYTATSSE